MPVAKESGGNFIPVPAGNHPARCFGCVSLGTQDGGIYPAAFKILLMFEIPGETIERDGKQQPMSVNKEYTLSLNEKANLRHDLDSWRGRPFNADELKGFEVSNVVGVACLLNVIHRPRVKDGQMQARIASISPLPKGMTVPEIFNPKIKFEVEDGRSDTFNKLPEWIRKKIEGCEEWISPADAPPPAKPVEDADSDSCPF